jgi:hypothetical protein
MEQEEVTYATRDPKSKIGTTVHIDLTDPPIFGDFLLQSVRLDQYHDESDELVPKYNVTASSTRASLNDVLLKSLSGPSSGAVSFAGVAPVASLSTPVSRTFGYALVLGNNFNIVATTAPTISEFNVTTAFGGGQTRFDDVAGHWYRKTMGNLSASTEIVMDVTNAAAYMVHNPLWVWTFRTRTVDKFRIFVAVKVQTDNRYQNNETNSIGTRGFGLRYSSDPALPDSGWRPFKTPGGGPYQFFPVLAPIAPNTVYTISISVSAGIATITINGVSMKMSVAEFPIPPADSGGGAYNISLNALNAVTADVLTGLDFKSFYFERD